MISTSTARTKPARSKWVAFAAALALAFGLSGVALQSASAAVGDDIYDENDSPNPLNATNALIFYKAADIGWWVNGVNATIPIADLGAMSYTVEDSTDFAPSFQLITKSDQFPYARLVWEAYQQNPAQGPNEGVFTDVQNGLWWTNKIPNPNQGSQSDPQPLSFFQNGAGAGWTDVQVAAIDLHQGTTTESTSLVTNVTYDGTSIPLGNADNTPFDQGDVDAAVDSYASTHHHEDGDYIGWSRASLSVTPYAGRWVGVINRGAIGTATDVKYQWYLNGKPAAGATKGFYKVPSTAKGQPVSVLVTGTYKFVRFGVQSNTVRAR